MYGQGIFFCSVPLPDPLIRQLQQFPGILIRQSFHGCIIRQFHHIRYLTGMQNLSVRRIPGCKIGDPFPLGAFPQGIHQLPAEIRLQFCPQSCFLPYFPVGSISRYRTSPSRMVYNTAPALWAC